MKSTLLSRGPLFLTVAVISSLFGLSGLEHGFFEVLQGNTKPDGFLISAIGSAQRFWIQGTEPAFTFIPNYLVTGCIAIFFSSAVIIWSLIFLQKKHAWIVLFLLSLAQFLTGGGFVQIFLAVPISLVSCRLLTPLSWWRNHIPERIRIVLAAPWLLLFILFIFFYIFALELAVFGFPFGITNPSVADQLMMILAGLIIVTFFLTIVSASAKESLRKIK